MKFNIFSRKNVILIALFAALLTFAASALAAAPVLRMGTTTSTDNTGLLDYLAPLFLKDTGIEVQWVSVGTGKAIEYGKNGDVDVILVHDPETEDKFVAEGFGVYRKKVMYNDFVLLGPAADPAGVKGKSISDAMKTVKDKQLTFTSRADKSGTHAAELRLWKEANIPAPDKEKWYVQTGQGMLETINAAGEKGGYTLADRGTFITYEANHKGKPPVVILVEGDKGLRNQYSVIAVNPAKWKNVKNDLAVKYADWLISPKTQKAIADYKVEGKQLFFPNADEK